VTIRDLSALAGVSTKTFYAHFSNIEACTISTRRRITSDWVQRADTEGEEIKPWVTAFLLAVSQHPRAASFALRDLSHIDPSPPDHTRQPLGNLESLLGRHCASDNLTLRSELHGAVVAGLLRTARTAVRRSGVEVRLAGDSFASWLSSLRDDGGPLRPPPGWTRTAMRGHAEYGRVAVDERSRLHSAALRLGLRDGYANLTLTKVRLDAGVSAQRFTQCFDSVAHCYLDALEARFILALRRAEATASRTAVWETQVHWFTFGLCVEIAEDPALSRLAFGELLIVGRLGLERREKWVAITAQHLRTWIAGYPSDSSISAEASAAAVWELAHGQLSAGRARLPRAAPLITFVLLAPAIGSKKAREAAWSAMRTNPT
jgi:AcrR family transcriptional regulator